MSRYSNSDGDKTGLYVIVGFIILIIFGPTILGVSNVATGVTSAIGSAVKGVGSLISDFFSSINSGYAAAAGPSTVQVPNYAVGNWQNMMSLDPTQNPFNSNYQIDSSAGMTISATADQGISKAIYNELNSTFYTSESVIVSNYLQCINLNDIWSVNKGIVSYNPKGITSLETLAAYYVTNCSIITLDQIGTIVLNCFNS